MQSATDFLTTTDVARAFDVDSSTVTRWVASGKLTPVVRAPRLFLFDPSYIEGLLAEAADWTPAS